MYGIYHHKTLSPIVKPKYKTLADAKNDIATRLKHWFAEATLEIAEPTEIALRKILESGPKAVGK